MSAPGMPSDWNQHKAGVIFGSFVTFCLATFQLLIAQIVGWGDGLSLALTYGLPFVAIVSAVTAAVLSVRSRGRASLRALALSAVAVLAWFLVVWIMSSGA